MGLGIFFASTYYSTNMGRINIQWKEPENITVGTICHLLHSNSDPQKVFLALLHWRRV